MHWAILMSILLVSYCTYRALTELEQFTEIDAEILVDPEFKQGSAYWHARGTTAVEFHHNQIHLINTEYGNGEVEQVLDISGGRFIRLENVARADGIVSGPEYFSGGSVVLKLFDAEGKTLKHELISILKNTQKASRNERTIWIPETVSSATLSIRLLRSSGDFIVNDLSLTEVLMVPSYRYVKFLLLIFWFVHILVAVWLAIKFLSAGYLLFTGVLIVGMAVLVLAPASVITDMNNHIYSLFPHFVRIGIADLLVNKIGVLSDSSAPSAGVSKLGHFFVFVALGFMVGYAYPVIKILYGAAILAVLSIASEVVQLFTYDRGLRVHDFMLDLTGGYTGFILGLMVICISTFYKIKTNRCSQSNSSEHH